MEASHSMADLSSSKCRPAFSVINSVRAALSWMNCVVSKSTMKGIRTQNTSITTEVGLIALRIQILPETKINRASVIKYNLRQCHFTLPPTFELHDTISMGCYTVVFSFATCVAFEQNRSQLMFLISKRIFESFMRNGSLNDY